MLDGYHDFITDLNTLVTTCPPPFIYVHDPMTPRISASNVHTALSNIKEQEGSCTIYAHVDAVSCFTPRLLYDTVLNAFAEWIPEWNEGCSNWSGPPEASGNRYNENFDAFLHGLRALHKSILRKMAVEAGEPELKFILVIERAERLKETMPDLMVPLTRFAELAQFDITVIMHSNVRWEVIRPSMGASPDPYYMDVPPLSRDVILARLTSNYPSASSLPQSDKFDPDTYHPNLKPLYSHFIATLYSVCSLYTKDPDELAYIAAARWPGFVQPVLDEHRQRVEALNSRRARGADDDGGADEEEGVDIDDIDLDDPALLELRPPDEHTRMRLTRLFTDSFSRALEHLYPRRTNALAWARANVPPENLLSIPPRQVVSVATRLPEECSRGEAPLRALPRMAKFVLVAAFLASTNPAKTDMRMFGRGPDERKKKRKRGSPRKMSAKNAAVKIPQRLLGPMPFPLDRMLAILGVLLEENDTDTRPPAPEYEIPGEYTEMEISRVAVYAQVMELTSMHLLQRTSPADRLGMSPVFKCSIGYDAAFSLSRDIGIALNDLMWEPV